MPFKESIDELLGEYTPGGNFATMSEGWHALVCIKAFETVKPARTQWGFVLFDPIEDSRVFEYCTVLNPKSNNDLLYSLRVKLPRLRAGFSVFGEITGIKDETAFLMKCGLFRIVHRDTFKGEGDVRAEINAALRFNPLDDSDTSLTEQVGLEENRNGGHPFDPAELLGNLIQLQEQIEQGEIESADSFDESILEGLPEFIKPDVGSMEDV